MARRKKYKRSNRVGFFSRKKSYRRSGGSSSNPMMTMGLAAVYGAARPTIANAVAPLTNKIPLGAISDEVGLGLTALLLKKFVKNPMVNKAADAVLIVESARIGEQLASGGIASIKGTTSTTAYVYG